MNCPDCNVAPGQWHQVGCSWEQCPPLRRLFVAARVRRLGPEAMEALPERIRGSQGSL
jgi:hypothetical protein